MSLGLLSVKYKVKRKMFSGNKTEGNPIKHALTFRLHSNIIKKRSTRVAKPIMLKGNC